MIKDKLPVNTQSIFISYAHTDLDDVEQLERVLKEHDISVWRDHEKLYAGEKWPKALGEAIAANDAVLLIWSRHAATSEFVELEWCTAIALKKTILPYRLDQTPLPSALKALHAIDAENPSSTTQTIRSLQTRSRDSDTGRATKVIKALDDIPDKEPKKVVHTAKEIFTQQHWTVDGNIYQATGDIHIHQAQPNAQKSGIEKWQIWLALVIGLLTVLGLLLDLPKKLAPFFNETQKVQVAEQPLSGSIRNEAGDPLSGVKIALPKFDLQTTTNQLGYFRFQVEALPEAQVELVAQKQGYKTHEQYATVGNTGLSFTMWKNE